MSMYKINWNFGQARKGPVSHISQDLIQTVCLFVLGRPGYESFGFVA